MARTYTHGDAMDMIRRHVTASNEDNYAAEICNAADRKMWMAFDWRESIANLPPFYLVPLEQDHGFPAVAVPKDFWGLRTAYLLQFTSNPTPQVWPLSIIRDLLETDVISMPKSIGYNESNNSFRVFPRVPKNIGAPEWMVNGTYKIRLPKLTAGTFAGTVLPFADDYFMNYCEVLKWAAYEYSGDTRAGGVQAQKDGGVVFTGQLAKAYEATVEMAMNEGLELGDPVIAPAEPLACPSSLTGNWWGGYFGQSAS
jgi:hypothetical protein